MWDAIVRDFSNITEPAAFAAFFQVLMIDLVLAGDNAIVVGALAAGLPPEQRRKVILIGVIAALVLRILFALIVTTAAADHRPDPDRRLAAAVGRVADVARPAPAAGVLARVRRDHRRRAFGPAGGQELERRRLGASRSPTSA